VDKHPISVRDQLQRLVPHLKGHIFLFQPRPAPIYDSLTGVRLLLIFFLLEILIGPRLALLSLLRLPLPPSWLTIPVLLVVALLLVRFFARLKLSQIGLYPWREWTTIEKSYFIQVFLLANLIFSLLFASRLRLVFADSSLWGNAAVALLTNFLWGFYQELIYRGILQTELVRRWGTIPGILVSNTLYTFGPLHFYHFFEGSLAQTLPMFAGIFAIGLFFAVVFRRSGNLAMVGIFHGIGDWYITGLATLLHK
jgi:membrane protease YdiL (CAAX protease family)